MTSVEVMINNKSGLHARPAAQFVAEANKFKASVRIRSLSGKEANAKSIMGLLGIGIGTGSRFEIMAEGLDEEQAVLRLKTFVESEICD